jgi:predicted transglutaminase-like cysteine proteinase
MGKRMRGHHVKLSNVAAVLLCILLHTAQASAGGVNSGWQESQAKAGKFAPEQGLANPPGGYVSFCLRSPETCEHSMLGAIPLAMTPARWKLLDEINEAVNSSIKAVTDEVLYGKLEYWTFPGAAGDCEDFVLLKRKLLIERGVSPADLLITVVLDERQQGHAVLTVATAEGDFILDNRRNTVRAWNETGYRFMKRQSAGNPNVWVSLTTGRSQTAELSSNSQK